MGIINLTDDSFYVGSRVEPDNLLETASRMIDDGADILDIGAESSSPGSERVPESQELFKIQKATKLLKTHFPKVPLSIDTQRASVAKAALEEGADIINDVSGISDPNMLEIVKKYNAGLVIMHSRGDSKTMDSLTDYDDLIKDMLDFFNAKIHEAKSCGIDKLIIDPGLGFAKTKEQNWHILDNLSAFKALGYPLLIGHSRKRFLDGSLEKTLEVSAFCAKNGVGIIRVHDVKKNYAKLNCIP